jgi:rhodanese-related sulfurtransferase
LKLEARQVARKQTFTGDQVHRSSLTNATAAIGLALGFAFGAPPIGAESLDIGRATFAEQDAKTGQISTDELRRILVDGAAILLDTRTAAEYAAGHIPGAHFLGDNAATQLAALTQLVGGDKSKALVLYCNGPYCQASRRFSEQLLAAGFANVRRYQLGMPVWRALGGPTEINLDGLRRVYGRDQTATFIDARPPDDFALGSLPGAKNLPVESFAAGEIKRPPLPQDDFNTRVVLFGSDAKQARTLAQALSTRPWHNVSYVAATFEEVRASVK